VTTMIKDNSNPLQSSCFGVLAYCVCR